MFPAALSVPIPIPASEPPMGARVPGGGRVRRGPRIPLAQPSLGGPSGLRQTTRRGLPVRGSPPFCIRSCPTGLSSRSGPATERSPVREAPPGVCSEMHQEERSHRATAAAPLLRCLCWEVIVVTGAVPSHSSDGQSVTLSQRALGPDRPPAFYKEIRHRIISATLLSALKKPPLSIFWERGPRATVAGPFVGVPHPGRSPPALEPECAPFLSLTVSTARSATTWRQSRGPAGMRGMRGGRSAPEPRPGFPQCACGRASRASLPRPAAPLPQAPWPRTAEAGRAPAGDSSEAWGLTGAHSIPHTPRSRNSPGVQTRVLPPGPTAWGREARGEGCRVLGVEHLSTHLKKSSSPIPPGKWPWAPELGGSP